MTNLPENWIKCALGDIIRIRNGYAFPKNVFINKENAGETAVPLIKQTQLSGYTIDLSDCVYVDNKYLREKEEFIVSYGDILIGLSGSIMKWCVYDKHLPALQNQRTGCIKKSNKDKNVKYILFYLRHISNDIIKQSQGMGILNISTSTIEKNTFPLPPLAEQGRIVAKIEELFAGIDAGIENLKAVKNQIALYRQSVLKSAFDFDASTFSALKNLIDKVRYGTSKKCSTEENVNSMPVYRIPNIDFKKGVLDKTDLKFASFDDSEKSSLMLKSGDILIIRSNGSLNLVGRAALVYNTDTNGLYAGYLMRLRIKDTEKLLPKFLLHFLNSGKARAYIEEKAKSTSGVNNINSEEISDLQIPVPTLAEQEKIVAEIESRFERADALETAVDRALNDAEKLKQAVLKKAFSGELVPQNPDDEPASVLLDRIRAARASELPAKKGKRKKTEVDSQL